MFRVFLMVVTAAVALAIVDWHYGGLDIGLPRQLTGGSSGSDSTSVLDKPAIQVLSAPDQLMIHEDGTVTIQASAPAAPGDPVVLQTAGTYGMGYNKVSQATLDENLEATLPVTNRDYVGSFRYWAMIPATGTYQQGKSTPFTIAFARPTPPSGRPDVSCGGSRTVEDHGSTWTCSYDDEFDGQVLDRRYWVPQTGGSKTGSGTTYACALDSPDTVQVAGGNLELSLVELPEVRKCTRTRSSRYAFGQVMHYGTFSQTYGKYEIRAKVPDIDVAGAQQSFWLWPVRNTYGAWPASGEIDFAELYSSTPGLDRPYLHYLPGTTTAGTNDNVTTARCPIRRGEFNTYGVEWKPGRITVLLNDEVCFVDDYSSAASFQGQDAPFDQPFYLSLNQAMGTLNNSYAPGTMPEKVTTEVDYVRVWKLDESAQRTRP
ncbi:MAG: family 16 glycosylhydrolase [Marmoricola sp.]